MEILRRGLHVCKFQDDTATVSEALMEVSTLAVSFSLPSFVAIKEGDYIDIEEGRFYVAQPVSVSKQSTGQYDYRITLENEATKLKRIMFLFLDEDASTTAVYAINTEFDLCATVGEFCDLICRNLNRNFNGWEWAVDAGVDGTKLQNITFSGNTCLEALQTICNAFELEWSITGKTIRISKEYSEKTGIILQYPQNLLSPVAITSVTADTECNRLFVYGGERNIPAKYGSTRLRLADGVEYLEDETARVFVREGVKMFDDIYPHRTGYVSSVKKVNGGTDENGKKFYYWQITDTSIDFDLKKYLKDVTAKISFTGGKLVGQEYEIASYNSTTKTIEIKSQTDSYGNTTPNDSYCPLPGDSYVILDIELPTEYVTAAERELRAEADKYFERYCQNQFQAEAQLSSAWLFENGLRLHPGCEVTLFDGDLNLNRAVRITKLERTLGGNEYGFKTKITLSTFVEKTRLATISGKVEKANRTILSNQRTTQNSITNITTNVTNINDLNAWKF